MQRIHEGLANVEAGTVSVLNHYCSSSLEGFPWQSSRCRSPPVKHRQIMKVYWLYMRIRNDMKIGTKSIVT